MKYYLIFIFAILLFWTAWFYTLFFIDPFESGVWGRGFFYISLFLALFGTLTISAFLFRRIIRPNHLSSPQARVSFRQGLLISFIVILSLYLMSKNMLRWWNGLFLILVIAALEATLRINEKARMPDKQQASPPQNELTREE